jgi:hypothetical protein
MASGEVFTKGIGHVIEGKIFQRAIDMLEEAGVKPAEYLAKIGKAKFDPTTLRNAFKQNNLAMTFDDTSWPEELARLGVRYIPGHDYWGGGVKTLLDDPVKNRQVRDIVLNNQRVVANLHSNPELFRVLGRELAIDPVRAPKWYSRIGNQMERNWGVPRQVAAALRGKLSSNTKFQKESVSATDIIENPMDMFRAGNQNTEYAVRQLIRGTDWMDDPRLWSSQGADSKTFNYAMNYIDPLNPQYVTNDIHQYAIGTGLAKELGGDASEIFGNRKLYQLWTDVTKQIADEMGMLPNEAQALMWTIWRDLMSGDVSGFERGRKLIVAPQVTRALEGKPKGLLDAMGYAARKREKQQIAEATAEYANKPKKMNEKIQEAKDRGDRRIEFTKNLAEQEGVKLDPRIRALMLLLGAGGGGAAAASSDRPEETSAAALRRMGLL